MRKNKPIKPLLTPWGKSLNQDCPLNEYPRPQLVRENWQCLNGRWDYAITETEEVPKTWDGAIIVPFSPESLLSGIGKRLLPGKRLWYRREFTFEKCKDGERLLLHFGAVDQHCSVYINGKKAGSHSGGYWPFYFDISGFLKDGKNEVVVSVTDDTDTGDEAYGKQTLNRGEIWYTGQSGIWQTVWAEKVPETYIQSVKITPHFKNAEVELELFMCGAESVPLGANASVKIFDGEKAVAEGLFQNNRALVKMPDDFKSWSPESPFLYDFEVKAGKDSIRSYFGMREFGILKGKAGPVLSLNGKPIFHHGLLDQGYWSDGMYTPPSDEAMIWEIKTLKNMGFNMLRKHIKIEPLRWYYHCDKIGMLVWQDFVSGGGPYKDFVVKYAPWLGFNFKDGKSRYALHGRKSETGRKNFMRDAERTIDLLYNISSIAVWVPFNEGWGQFDAASAAALVRKKDAARLIDHASGYFDQGAGDFHSYHIYYKAFRPKKDNRGRVLALTEFGGFSLPVQEHMSSDILFGYKMFKTKEELNDAVWKLYVKDVFPAIEKGLSASIYTQVSDVEDEINGLFTYDRKKIKFDEGLGLKITKTLNEIFKEKFNGNL
ncbi:glycoside hydrolase family 2 protein [Treponema denticola]|uniref:glycoside hydrolase family 2 protein n=1 Tax=Treponema denticola TaxID=158 RepID=UPI0020A34B65|nr:sugar-binding domain-containing protein [Treponema denticola]UTC82614.1 glycoside hydrolase family 2 [Treponema denticola]